jgi:hypothetical protein
MTIQLSPEEHLMSRLEVELERGLEATYDQVATERLIAYCVACQHLAENVQAAIEIGGEPMRLYLAERLRPTTERMEATIAWLQQQIEE